MKFHIQQYKVKLLNREYKIIVVVNSMCGSRERIPPRSRRMEERW